MIRLLLLAALLSASAAFASERVYIGTYTGRESRGVYAFDFNPENGAMTGLRLAAPMADPSFLAFDPSRRHLYAVDEHDGMVAAFAVDRASGALAFLNRRSTGGSSAAHLAVDPTGRMLVAANYGSGTVAAFPLEADGRIGPRSAFLTQRGPPGPNRLRQSQSHPHSVVFSPDGRFAMVCDLGLDRIFVYRADPSRAELVPNAPPFATVPPGAGPRHSAFSPDGRFFYAVCEMGGIVCAFSYDAGDGALKLLQTVSTLPSDAFGLNGSAEIQIDPTGRRLYASNRDVLHRGRGSDSLAVFSRDPGSGRLRRVEVVACGGRVPRSFSLSPDGGWLLCAHQDSNDITLFRVNRDSGRLTPAPGKLGVGQPVCLLFYGTTDQ